MSALNPYVYRIEKFHVPRWLAITFVFTTILSVLSLLIWGVSPFIVVQIKEFVINIPFIIRQTINVFDLSSILDVSGVEESLPDLVRSFSDEIVGAPGDVIRATISLFGHIFNIFTLGIFTFYLSLERKKIKDQLILFVPPVSRKRISNIVRKVERQLGKWVRVQLLLMVSVGLLTWIGLSILGVRFAVSLAIVVGLLEIIPFFGPTIATIPAIMVGLTQSVWHGIAVLHLYIFIQQLENSIIIPKFMKRVVGLDPLVVILALMVGERLGSTIGAILAIPIAVVLNILWVEFRND